MMRCMIWAGLVALLAARLGHGGPVDGQFALPKQRINSAGAEPTTIEFNVKFRGGQRACVWVRGDHKPVVPLDITVHDAAGTVVARDESDKDFLAAFWVPPRTAEYRIVIRNHGKEEFRNYPEHERYTDVYVVFK